MTEPQRLFSDRTSTPLGDLMVIVDDAGHLRLVQWLDGEGNARTHQLLHPYGGARSPALTPASNPAGVTAAIRAYFEGDLSAIDTLPVTMGGTPFQREVWSALRKIPCGTTTSYSALARSIGRPMAVRAVGLANGANPVGVVVPCHRVIGADGSLTGFGAGIPRKRWLLAHEGARTHTPELPFASPSNGS